MVTLRQYELFIGKAELDKSKLKNHYIYNQQVTNQVAPSASNDTIPPTGEFIKITELQITADIQYNKDSETASTQPIKINIYNPNQNTLRYIKEGNNVVLNAGYNTDATLTTLAVCQIMKATVRKKGTDVVAELLCSDSASLRKEVYFYNSYPANTPYTQIINDFIKCYKDNGVALGRFDTSKIVGKLTKGSYAFEGLASKSLSTLLKNITPAHKCYTTINRLFIVPNEGEELVDVVILTEDDFKRSVDLLTETTGTKAEKKKEYVGIKVNTFLNGACSTAGFVRIKGGAYEGDYGIKTVSHKLDFEGSSWDTDLELIG